MRAEIASLTLVASLTLSVHAQQAAQNPPKPVYGSVTGHVYCSDTNDPARLAVVTLLPIADTLKPSFTQQNGPNRNQTSVFRPAQTLLDGSFTMPRVAPGYYYVVVQYPGYLSPVSQLSSEELAHPSAEMQKFIASVLPTIAVDASRTATTEIRLQRGDSISGTVRFDDGSPAPNLNMHVLHKDNHGKWVPVVLGTGVFSGRVQTDDQGHYRLAGLPAGEYILRTDLELDDIWFSRLFGSGGSSSSGTRYSIAIYSGGQAREKDAKPIKLHDGEDDSGEDIVIPVSRLHSISGTLVEARTGETINAGTVTLLYADDKTQAATAKVNADDATFHLDFVPEGNYILKVSNARAVSREEIPNPPGSTPPSHTKETTIRSYGEAEQPILVQNDISSVIVSVPDKSAKTANAQ